MGRVKKEGEGDCGPAGDGRVRRRWRRKVVSEMKNFIIIVSMCSIAGMVNEVKGVRRHLTLKG